MFKFIRIVIDRESFGDLARKRLLIRKQICVLSRRSLLNKNTTSGNLRIQVRRDLR